MDKRREMSGNAQSNNNKNVTSQNESSIMIQSGEAKNISAVYKKRICLLVKR